LLKSALSEQDSYLNLKQVDFSDVFYLSLNQGVAGVAFQGLRKTMAIQRVEKKDLGSTVQVYDKWFAASASIILHRDKILRLQSKLSSQFQKEGIRAIVLKGLSIANYYDDAQLRCFGDLDIYSPIDYQKIDEILKLITPHLSIDYYRHSECRVDGVMVENHRYLTDVRGQSRFYCLEKFLQDEAFASLATMSETGLTYPNENFTFIFFVYHALSHFLYEKLSLKFLVDWCWMLKGRNEIRLDILDEKLEEYGLMHFAAAMTALCVQRLGLQEEFVSKGILDKIKSLSPSLIKRFEEDLFISDYETFSSNSLKDRLKRGKEFYKKRWKIREFLGVSTSIFLLEKVYALLMHKFEIKEI